MEGQAKCTSAPRSARASANARQRITCPPPTLVPQSARMQTRGPSVGLSSFIREAASSHLSPSRLCTYSIALDPPASVKGKPPELKPTSKIAALFEKGSGRLQFADRTAAGLMTYRIDSDRMFLRELEASDCSPEYVAWLQDPV